MNVIREGKLSIDKKETLKEKSFKTIFFIGLYSLSDLKYSFINISDIYSMSSFLQIKPYFIIIKNVSININKHYRYQ